MTGNQDENVRGVAGEGSKPVRPCNFEVFIRYGLIMLKTSSISYFMDGMRVN